MSIEIYSIPMKDSREEIEIEVNPWFKNGIEESDIVLAKYLGMVEDPEDIIADLSRALRASQKG